MMASGARTANGRAGILPYLVVQYRAALRLLHVLDRHYLDDHEIVGNLGAMYSMLKEDENAVRFLKRAVDLAPEDPIDTWNLGRIYDFTGKSKLANRWYRRSLVLDSDPARLAENQCLYAEFVETKLRDLTRACALQRKHCAESRQLACREASP